MKKLLLFLVLVLIIVACDEKPTDPLIPKTPEEIDWNQIKFTPDTINLKPGFTYNIEFSGINFEKVKIDSIIIDNKKLEIVEINESKIISKIHNANPGTYQIEFYQEGKVFILDKKIIFIPMEYKEPTKDNIYFLPDTIYIDENNKEINFTLYGTDFEKYKIDEVFLNNEECNITKIYRDSLLISYEEQFSTNNEISILYNGNKTILQKKLIVIFNNSPLNLAENNFLSLEIRNFLVYNKYVAEIYDGYTLIDSYVTKTTKNISKKYDNFTDLRNCTIEYPFRLRKHVITVTNYRLTLDLILDIDPNKKIIKYFTLSCDSNFSELNYKDDRSSFHYTIENLPYTLSNVNDKPQIVVEVKGKDIDRYLPYFSFYDYLKIGPINQTHIQYNSTISRIDSLARKPINYFPATDNSYIRITIGN